MPHKAIKDYLQAVKDEGRAIDKAIKDIDNLKTKIMQTETIKAKALQYDKSGNKVITKRVELTKYLDGVFLSETKIVNYQPECKVYFECNGVFWYFASINPDYLDNYKANLIECRKDYFNYIDTAAQSGKFIKLLDVEIYKALNLDIAPLLAARAEYLRKESERLKAENAERQRIEAERIENEKRAKLAKIETAEKAMQDGNEISAEQIELLAEKYGVKIHIRTLGLIRAKVNRAKIDIERRVTVWGRGLTTNNINGVCNVMHDIKAAICAAEVDKLCKEKSMTRNELMNEILAHPIFAD